MKRLFQNPVLLAAAGPLVLVLIGVPGCGTGEYERRLGQTADRISKMAVFDPVSLNTMLGDSGLRFGLPKVFTMPLTVESGTEDRPVNIKRVKIPFMELGEYLTTYEAFVTDKEGGKTPYYLYLAAVPLPKGNKLASTAEAKPDIRSIAKPREPAEAIPATRMDETGYVFQKTKAALPKGGQKWEDVEFANPKGERVAWQKLEASGDLETFYDPGMDATHFKFTTMPTTVEVYARIEGEQLVLVLWRVPASLTAFADFGPKSSDPSAAAKLPLEKAVPLVAGSLTASNF